MIKNRTIILLIVFLLAGCANKASAPLEPILPKPIAADAQPVIIDTDMASDDLLAILYLLGRSDVDVRAITVTGAGEAHCAPGTRNALNLIALAGRPDIPVTCGREAPLEGGHAFPTAWRERVDNLLGLTLPQNSRGASGETTVDLLRRIIRESPRKVHLLVLGPATNVAEMLEAEPALAMNLEMITIVGGAVEVPGNVGISSDIDNDTAEWNFYVDPRAAAVVILSGAPVTLVPVDVTNHVPVTMDFYERLEKDRTNSVAEFAYRVLTAQKGFIQVGYYFWDPLAAAMITEPGLCTYEEMPIVVVEEEGPESGRTVKSEQGSVIRVAMTADLERLETLFLDTINGRLP